MPLEFLHLPVRPETRGGVVCKRACCRLYSPFSGLRRLRKTRVLFL
jgi:hypothetical protein